MLTRSTLFLVCVLAGVKELVSALHLNNIEVFLVSGGFRLMIEPVAEQLQIPLRNIYANTIYFDDAGNFAGFDDTELTSRDGGKAEAINMCVVCGVIVVIRCVE